MVTRRQVIGSSLTLAATAGIAAPNAPRRGRLKQSVSRWCYQKIPLDDLCAFAVRIGLQGIDLLQPAEYAVPRRHGLRCTMGYAADMMTIPNGLNRHENHAAIEQAFRVGIPQAARAGVPNVIAFSGNRRGLSDEEGAASTVAGLNRVKRIAEDNDVTICLELLNSKGAASHRPASGRSNSAPSRTARSPSAAAAMPRPTRPCTAMYRMASTISRKSTRRGRPHRLGGGINGAISNHSASVRSLA